MRLTDILLAAIICLCVYAVFDTDGAMRVIEQAGKTAASYVRG